MKLLKKHLVLVLIPLFLPGVLPGAGAQYVPTHISNQGIYIFLDELASEHCINLFSLVKPYSRYGYCHFAQ